MNAGDRRPGELAIARVQRLHPGLYPCKAVTVHFLGCTLGCEGCWNPQYWEKKAESIDPASGGFFTGRVALARLSATIRAFEAELVVFSGGEPLQQPGILRFLGNLHGRADFKSFLYTGYTPEELPHMLDGLKQAGVGGVCTGRYEQGLEEKGLWPATSSNQRLFWFDPEVKELLTKKTALVLIGEDETVHMGFQSKDVE